LERQADCYDSTWGPEELEPVLGQVNVAVSLTVDASEEPDLHEWYKVEHIPLLSKVQGWRRSVRYRLVAGSPGPKFLAVHEYLPENGVRSSPEFTAAVVTDDAKRIVGGCKAKGGNAFERREWVYERTVPIYPSSLPENLRKFVEEFYVVRWGVYLFDAILYLCVCELIANNILQRHTWCARTIRRVSRSYCNDD
jgi:hypothetical protein